MSFKYIIDFFLKWTQHFGRAFVLCSHALISFPKIKFLPKLLMDQIYNLGVLSLLIIILSAFSVGAVLSLQFYTELVRFSAEGNIGAGLAIVIIRELSPVMTALLFSGRSGSALTSEIGLMKANQQLTVMDMMAVDPMKYILFPRLIGGFISVPILSAIFSMIAIFSGYLVAVLWLGVDEGLFWAGMKDAISVDYDLLNSLIKSVVFGVLITCIAVFHGYDSLPTPAGINSATTRTVVYSAVTILSVDFLLTFVMFGEL